MRLLLLLIILAAAAYYTVPTQAAHEAEARATVEAYRPSGGGEAGVSLDSIVGYVRGMMVGQGRYETFYLFSKYSLDMPGAAFVECYGAFTLVRCSVVEPGAQPAG